MTRLGNNTKITVGAGRRDAVRAFADALGAKLSSTPTGMDILLLEGETRIGFAYVPDEQALTEAQLRLAPWLELIVDDVDAAARRLAGIGLARVEYADREHPYLTGPGGFVFRLAAAPAAPAA
jgi:hypothetical protein